MRWMGLALCALLIGGCRDRNQAELVLGRLRVFPASLDFNQVAIHDSKSLSVQLKNFGRGPLRIEQAWVESPPGIYSAALTEAKQQMVIAGGVYPIEVSFAPRQVGAQEGVLRVRTDSADEPTFQLPLTGVGVDARAQMPQRVLNFGRIEAQSKKTLSLLLKNPSPLAVEVTARVVGADRDEFDAPPARLEPGEEKPIPVTFAPERVGRKEAGLAVTPCRGCAEEPVTIIAEALDKALIPEPPVVDFGQVPVDRELILPVRLHNISTEPVTVTALALQDGTDTSFSARPQVFPVVIPGETIQGFDHRYGPSHMGGASGATVFQVASVRNPTVTVGLTGHGGAPELCVSPTEYDFGSQPVGSKTAVVVTIRNCGASIGAPLTVSSFTFDSGDASEFNAGPIGLPVALPAGAEVRVKVFYEPSRAGGAAASWRLQTSVLGGDVLLKFQGSAQQYAPCSLELKPSPILDFGTLPPGQGAVLGIRVKNVGPELCALKDIHVSDDGGGVFFMPGGTIDGVVMYQGDYFAFQVAARGQPSQGPFNGAVQMQPASTSVRTVPLRLNVQNSCLLATPPFLDFGLGRLDCPLPDRQVNFRNQCTSPVSIASVFIGPGTTDALDATGPEFRLVPDPPPFPPTLGPGGAFSVEVRYLGRIAGMNLSPLFVQDTSLLRPLLVPLLGESSATKSQVDHFVQQDGSKVDVLFVLDNSDSMQDEDLRMQSAIPAFAQEVQSRGVDVHIAVTTTGIDPVSNACPGGAQGGEAGRIFPVDGSLIRMMTQATPNLAGELQTHAQVGACAFVEQGFEAMRRAFTQPLLGRPMVPPPNDGNAGFLRDSAALAVVFFSDEDDHSPDDVATYAQFLRTLKGAQQPQRAVAFAIAPTPTCLTDLGGSGDRYAQLTQLTGGKILGSCSDAASYASFLRQIAAQAFSPQDAFPLSARPEGGVVTVTVNGVPQTTGWTYDGGSNSVVFNPRPGPGAQIDMTYRRACGT